MARLYAVVVKTTCEANTLRVCWYFSHFRSDLVSLLLRLLRLNTPRFAWMSVKDSIVGFQQVIKIINAYIFSTYLILFIEIQNFQNMFILRHILLCFPHYECFHRYLYLRLGLGVSIFFFLSLTSLHHHSLSSLPSCSFVTLHTMCCFCLFISMIDFNK